MIEQLEKSLNREVPDDLWTFFLAMNGLKVFSNALHINGFRFNYARTGPSSIQPFNILTPNLDERIEGAPLKCLFIGGFSHDGSSIFIDSENSTIHRCAAKSWQSLNTWPNIESMLESEVIRLSKLYDLTGRKL